MRIALSPVKFLRRTLPTGIHRRLASQKTRPVKPPQALPLAEEKTKKENVDVDVVGPFMELIELAKEKSWQQKRIGFLRHSLRDPKLIPSRPLLAQNIIQFLFERRLFDDATKVYRNMLQDGVIPLPSTDALFLAIVVSASQATGPNQLEGIKTVLTYKTFTEPYFMEFLQHMAALDVPAETAAELTRLYISFKEAGDEGYRPSRALIFKLIDLQAQAGQIEAAADTIALYDVSASGTSSPFDTSSEPYARAIHSAPVSDQAAVDWIMGVMREKDVPVHIVVFNALISRYKQLKDLRKVFAIYAVLMRLAHNTPLRPDATTYKHLFRAMGYLYKNDYKPNASRSDRDSGTIPLPRELFADMMVHWFSVSWHPPLPEGTSRSEREAQMHTDASLLLLAFRAFLYLDDYVAALVVLQLMFELGIPLTERVYFVLVQYMARKVFYDVSVARARSATSMRQPVLAFYVLGGEFRYSKMDKGNKAHKWIVERMIAANLRGAGGDGEGKDEEGAPAETGSSRGRVPTYEEIRNQAERLSGDKLDEWPLVSILHRAIRSSAPDGQVWGDKWRQRVVRKARWEMVPEGEYWSWGRGEVKKRIRK